VCPALITGNAYPAGSATLPTSLQGPSYISANPNYPGVAGETPGKFTIITGLSNMAKYVAFTALPGGNNPATIVQGRLGYIGADYVLPYAAITKTNSYNLNSASLKNSLGQYTNPSPAGALAAFGTVLPPQSTRSGKYAPSITGNGLRSNPQDWVQNLSSSAPLANPTHRNAYPIVGTANFLGYSCYQNAAQLASLLDVLTAHMTSPLRTDPVNGVLARAGIAPLPAVWRVAISDTFLTNSAGLGLAPAVTGSAGVCAAPGIVGG
jgi:hypothetical protein